MRKNYYIIANKWGKIKGALSSQTDVSNAIASAGITDHGELSGLADDDHTQYIKHALATAINDFLVASGSGAFVKKTLAETKSILGASGFVDRGDPAAWDWTLANFTTDATWRDLDCSAIVPAGAAWIYFGVQLLDDAANSAFLIRKNGNVNTVNAFRVRTQVANVGVDGWGFAGCDANRVVEYYGSNLAFAAINLVVLGWM